jgi:hypothetical protein
MDHNILNTRGECRDLSDGVREKYHSRSEEIVKVEESTALALAKEDAFTYPKGMM